MTHIGYRLAITTQRGYPVDPENLVILSFCFYFDTHSLMPPLQHATLLHRILRHANVLLVVSPGEGPLIRDAERREAERIVRLQFTCPARMLNRFLMLAKLLQHDRQRRMRERITRIPRECLL